MIVEQIDASRTNIKETEMHKAKILAIQCIDLRFQKMIDDHVREQADYGEFDRISWPGASRDFENVKNSALISLKLHNPDAVLIYEHVTCGAYGDEDANETHKANAQRLADALVGAKPSLDVQILIATPEGVQRL